MSFFRRTWLYMLEFPWRHSGPDNEKGAHWLIWVVGWAWAIAGLVLGAFIAPTIVQIVGLSKTPVQDTFDVGVAVLAGFIVQLLSWPPFSLLRLVIDDALLRTSKNTRTAMTLITIPLLVLIPLAGVGYALYRYFTFVGPGQTRVSVAFAGGLLVKAFVIPAIVGIVQSAAFRRLMTWLRGSSTSK